MNTTNTIIVGSEDGPGSPTLLRLELSNSNMAPNTRFFAIAPYVKLKLTCFFFQVELELFAMPKSKRKPTDYASQLRINETIEYLLRNPGIKRSLATKFRVSLRFLAFPTREFKGGKQAILEVDIIKLFRKLKMLD